MKTHSTEGTPYQEVAVPKQDAFLRDLQRFQDLSTFLLDYTSLQKGKGTLIVDVAAGSGDPGIGLLSGLMEVFPEVKYLGSDILPFPSVDNRRMMDTLVSSAVLPEQWRDFWQHGGNERYQLQYGQEWDATVLTFWQKVKEFGEPLFLLIRHPDVLGDVERQDETFLHIFQNLIACARENSVPVVVTTSNFDSLQRIYELLLKVMESAGYHITHTQHDQDWDMKNFQFADGENMRKFSLRTYLTKRLVRSLGFAGPRRGEYPAKRLDLLTIIFEEENR